MFLFRNHLFLDLITFKDYYVAKMITEKNARLSKALIVIILAHESRCCNSYFTNRIITRRQYDKTDFEKEDGKQWQT